MGNHCSCRFPGCSLTNNVRRHKLFENHKINGKRVLLSKLVGAGTASGSFDRAGYCV